ncbi:MAG: phenylalanine--tRNA ligase subunit beta [Planctomycetaceae bacterium]|nr:phenylalanine--tRNA ligase subunit beta [Planctomycetaceae bacterium]
MLVSWNWLKQYVDHDLSVEEVTHELTMSGLNLEGVEEVSGDICVDLEVTSNRPDCLGHIGVAREIAALFEKALSVPDPQPATGSQKVTELAAVENRSPELCPQYIARVITGVKVGPSPDWLVERLATIGQPSVNNIVDITNYVLMECGQPLHAFDLDKLGGRQIVVREATKDETITAIDQKEYKLDAGTCVIADESRPVAIAGVMGGLETEIGEATIDILIETAAFQPISVRNTARALNLHSPSSYRFERGVDLEQLDWASRRCCELILELAGGELAEGAIKAGAELDHSRTPVTLRYPQVERLLGIPVSADESDQILASLGLEKTGGDTDSGQFLVPSWRRDLSREVDLIEEVARIHGYEKIPTDAAIDVVSSSRTLADRVSAKVRHTLTSLGLYEAITLSFVTREQFDLWHPGDDNEPLAVEHSSRKQENILRRSLIPSLLQWRRENEKHSQFNACLFEIARVYHTAEQSVEKEEAQPRTLGLVGGWSFRELRGVLETIVSRVNRHARLEVRPCQRPQFEEGRAAELLVNGEFWGVCGELTRGLQGQLDLRDAVSAAEVSLSILEEICELTPAYESLPQYPSVERDLNFVLPEEVPWQKLEETVRQSAGPLLSDVEFVDQYRGKQIAADSKSYVLSVSFRSEERTLTGEEVDSAQQQIIAACEQELSAALR